MSDIILPGRLQKLLEKDNLRILTVVRDHISGLLYAVPAIRALRQHFPKSKLMLLGNAYAIPVLEGCPYLDAVIPFYRFCEDEKGYKHLQSLAHRAQAWIRLAGRVDLVVHLRSVGGQTLLFCRLLGNPVQVGYTQLKYDHLLDLNLGVPDVNLDSRSRNNKILEGMGLPPTPPEMEMWIPAKAKAWAESWLLSQGWRLDDTLFIFHPGCHWGCNEWLVERWAALGNAIREKYGCKIVITGTKREYSLATKIAQGMDEKPVIASGHTNLIRFAALLDKADFVISVDTAPTQICQALKKPSVVLMGAGNPAWNGPLPGEPMRMLQKWDSAEEGTQLCDFAAGICHNTYCRSRLAPISVEEVLAAVETVLASSKTILCANQLN